ncbi:hypothetical protein PHLGIDRAFT_126650 [Phlebiopsis gigantea 11061_1 CR5-6]|uniref:PBP domain-containing protein n=1 Tax=Phlebiopsis gigantea (strain 11061_1 CR5-6) TaxID=745531 RepID=A0A0C3SA60_PHLG1|nr:hypothetical protein PHLGIDRAFT_126650 [Phlebiopsis gigantea 11061_1 CR5-6]
MAQATYDGGFTDATDVRLRLANGGAGQTGLIGAFANAFIQDQVKKGAAPFKVEWYLGDTTQSLGYLAASEVDVAFTYNEAAELASIKSGAAVSRDLVFLDHFYLVGPLSNPAGLSISNDGVSDMFNKIVASGNAHVAHPPSYGPPTRFLSRYDKSATNIKESEMFCKIGQVPWALPTSVWYHQYPRFPIQALEAASLLSEYTLTDRGIWLSSTAAVTEVLAIYKAGSEDGDRKMLLNPCSAILSAHPLDQGLSKVFMDWLLALDGGQKVVSEFKKSGQVLYAPARIPQ